jgi:RNA polymerase sigma-70 factor, ECF subfamily
MGQEKPTNYSSLDDESLLAIMAVGHGPQAKNPVLSEAVSTLYDRYGRLVFSIAIQVVGDTETAEEITQDVFVKAWEGAHSYRSDIAKVSSWLISITRHRAIDELRRRGIRPEKDQVNWANDAEIEGVETIPTSEGPEDLVESTLERYKILNMVGLLPSDQRQVLGLAFFNGLSHSQIANLLGEPLGTVKSRIRLAMEKLRDMMLEQGIIRD